MVVCIKLILPGTTVFVEYFHPELARRTSKLARFRLSTRLSKRVSRARIYVFPSRRITEN